MSCVSLRIPAVARSRRASSRAGARGSVRVAASAEGVSRVGGRWIDEDDGIARETFGFDLGGEALAKHTFTFRDGQEGVGVTVGRPLGIVFEEKLQKCVAVEVAPGSNAEKAGVREGDILRATTAVFQLTAPPDVSTWMQPNQQIQAQAYFVADGQSFKKCMNAIISNGESVDTPEGDKREIEYVSLVLERPSIR
mmetsp:Transcript_7894/g.26207  ORF Transcript_7894/g.26207 Transcript_7894/m.26207 type:complete len:195 (+) Transcript_7894:10-594(+)